LNGLAAIRSRKNTWGRRVLATYVVAWMAIVLQPCVVAGEIEHDCPHCPPELSQESHHQEMKASSDCEIGGQQTLESTSQQFKLKDAAGWVPVALVHMPYDFGAGTTAHQPFARPSAFFAPGGPPLNVLHCVYLK